MLFYQYKIWTHLKGHDVWVHILDLFCYFLHSVCNLRNWWHIETFWHFTIFCQQISILRMRWMFVPLLRLARCWMSSLWEHWKFRQGKWDTVWTVSYLTTTGRTQNEWNNQLDINSVRNESYQLREKHEQCEGRREGMGKTSSFLPTPSHLSLLSV